MVMNNSTPPPPQWLSIVFSIRYKQNAATPVAASDSAIIDSGVSLTFRDHQVGMSAA